MTAESNAIVLRASTPFLTDQGGNSYGFTRCIERHICDLGGAREYRLAGNIARIRVNKGIHRCSLALCQRTD